MVSFFSRGLLNWHAENPRPLPWDNGPRDAYHIWISEIILQQTRLEQGTPYYLKFISRFPTVHLLASASLDEVLRYWQGLGYYSRARNLHKTARHIVDACNGIFPSSFDELIKLPGIGPYSAAAIASFAFALPYPVVDGNVKRVISRFAGLTESIDNASVHEKIRSIAADFMKDVLPGTFNQAIMNFGALVCKPKGALCEICPVSKKCYAFRHDLVQSLPVRSKKKTQTIRYFHFVILRWRDKFLMYQREEKDIWQGLYTPPVMERNSSRKPTITQIVAYTNTFIGHVNLELIGSSPPQNQTLSHQMIIGRFHYFQLLSAPKKLSSPFVWVTQSGNHDLGKPKMIVNMPLIFDL